MKNKKNGEKKKKKKIVAATGDLYCAWNVLQLSLPEVLLGATNGTMGDASTVLLLCHT
jgi:hypothetical protein